MKKYILSVNCGSSSLKFNLFELDGENQLSSFLSGIVEEIGYVDRSRLRYSCEGTKHEHLEPVSNHQDALILLFRELEKNDIPMDSICGVGHRVVHGGDKYTESVLIDH